MSRRAVTRSQTDTAQPKPISERDLSPVRVVEKPQAKERSFTDTVVKWLGEKARKPLIKDGLYGAQLNWELDANAIREWSKKHFAMHNGKPFKYHAVILFYVDMCYRPGRCRHKYELAVLLSRLNPSRAVNPDAEKITKLLIRINTALPRFKCAGSPLWNQLNRHLDAGTMWANYVESRESGLAGHYTLTTTLNYVRGDPMQYVMDNRTIPDYISPHVDPHIVDRIMQEKELSARSQLAISEANLDRASLDPKTPEYAEACQRLNRAHAHGRRALFFVHEIEQFIAARLPYILPEFNVGLPTFSGRSELFIDLKRECEQQGCAFIELEYKSGPVVRLVQKPAEHQE